VPIVRARVVVLSFLAVAVAVFGLGSTLSVTIAAAQPELEPTAKPAGAADPGTDEWYSVALPDGKISTLGVYRPERHANGAAILVLHGKDGPRRLYEEIAREYADKGFIAIAACWFAYPGQLFDDSYGCPGVGEFVGAEDAVVDDVDAVVDAAHQVRGVHDGRLGVEGQSYGARVALLRAAASGGREPVVSSCGYLAERPVFGDVEATRFPYPSDPEVAARIVAPVLVVHGEADPITPLGQAEAFVAAMKSAAHSVDFETYGSPAGHSLPWDIVSAFDDPEHLLRDRFRDDTAAWFGTHLRDTARGEHDSG
jgi:dienelactone hydrolase